jgi:hypothetical protein
MGSGNRPHILHIIYVELIAYIHIFIYTVRIRVSWVSVFRELGIRVDTYEVVCCAVLHSTL